MIIVSVALFAFTTPLRGGVTAETKIQVGHTPDGIRFGLIGEIPAGPAPTLLLLEGELEVAKRVPLHVEVGRILNQHGVLCVMLDEPCHGENQRPGEQANLTGWRARLDQGDDFVKHFVVQAQAVVDYLIKEHYTDPKRIAAGGTSGGAFLSFHLAAADPRIRSVGAICPVADLMAVREFQGTAHAQKAESLSLARLAPKLAWRPTWVSIGNHDIRLDTDRVIAFTRALVRAAAEGEERSGGIPVELIVNATEGHRSTIHDHELLAAWMLGQFDAMK